MSNLKHIIQILAMSLAALFCSCSHEGPETGPGFEYDYGQICFGLSDVTVSGNGPYGNAATRGGELTDFTDKYIMINAMQDATKIYNNSRLIPDNSNATASTGLWKVDTRKWAGGSTYSFYGYTASTAYNSSNGNYTGLTGVRSSNGMSFTITQPDDYSTPDDMVDYLLSYNYRVADGRTRPIVRLDFEHVLPMVEILVLKDPSIKNAYVSRIGINGIYHSATMRCTSQSNYGEQTPNQWESLPIGSTTGYTIENSFSYEAGTDTKTGGMEATDEEATTSAVMQIMSVPQQLGNTAVLTVEYWVNEKSDESEPDNYVKHENSFSLFNYSPFVWESGHRIRYVMTIDTGISLVGRVMDWKDVDFIEGVVLPEIGTGNP